jgi:hypothetical protein
MKINIKALSFTLAIVWGGLILLMGLANLIWPTYAISFLEIVASVYPGYQAVPSFGEVLAGTLYGLVDGFVLGFIVGWLYNLFVGRSNLTEPSRN